MPVAGVAVSGGYAGDGSVIRAGLPGRGRLCPGAEVFGAGVPRQEPFQRLAGERFPAVAAAFVEVRGEPGQDVEAGHPGGRGGGPDDGGAPGGVAVPGPAGVLPGHDRPADLPFRSIIVLRALHLSGVDGRGRATFTLVTSPEKPVCPAVTASRLPALLRLNGDPLGQ